MSELIQKYDNRADIRWKLLTGASALALTAYIASASGAGAEGTDHPQIWVELGGQMEMMNSFSSPFTAPFTLLTPTPDPYKGESPTSAQRTPRYAIGLDGKISFQPENSDWMFSAGIQYGRAHGNKHVHHQTKLPTVYRSQCISSFFGYQLTTPYCTHYTNFHLFNKVADTKARHDEKHVILDFQAGKDVGLGLFGRHGTSNISAGVRIAQFTAKSDIDVYARPTIYVSYPVTYFGFDIVAHDHFNQYFLHASARRSFKGIGPSLAWSGSAAIAGNEQDEELDLDWGINAALLFGKQKARTRHRTVAYTGLGQGTNPPTLYTPRSAHSTRSRRVTVPNIGGYAGLSLKWPNAKISIGYRYDTFLNAMDTGIDVAKKSNLTFNGPYASISIGLGD